METKLIAFEVKTLIVARVGKTDPRLLAMIQERPAAALAEMDVDVLDHDADVKVLELAPDDPRGVDAEDWAPSADELAS